MFCKNYTVDCGKEKIGCKGCYYNKEHKKMIFLYVGKVKDLKIIK